MPPWRSAGTRIFAVEALAHDLLLPFLDERENPRRRKIRLIGVRAEKLLRESTSEEGG